jgi:hypothetical protein
MEFNGFEHLTANYLYCPNQFFDVCLPNHSRGTVRLVAYILRKTLGWLDEEGNPVEQDITISYRDLITEAGISRGAIRKALDDAVKGGFITCIHSGKANENNQSAEMACYTLRWATDDHYQKNADNFNGFFSGEGHRTPIPNSFFDQVVKRETLSVVKVVGSVLRHTIGYQNQFGGRRQIAPLSYSYILNYSNMSDRTTLGAAIQHAIETGYIYCVQKGTVNPSNNERRPSTYAIRWHEQANLEGYGTKTRPVDSERYKNQTNNGTETRLAKRFKNQTEEITPENNTYKQKDVAAVEILKNTKRFQILREAGFDESVALELSESRGLDEIKKQIDWLPHRKPDRNSLGMLRRAIEIGWSKPELIKNLENKEQRLQKDQIEAVQAEIEDDKVSRSKEEKKRLREELKPVWDNLSRDEQTEIEQMALKKLNCDYFRNRFQRNDEYRLNQCLDSLSQHNESAIEKKIE